uniref:Uncharacterized protein n=1 Tax=Salmo trutta TaxID=8032 RepID=A0A673XYE7_SALTR
AKEKFRLCGYGNDGRPDVRTTTLSCSLVEGLYLREAESMQELLCTPSQHRTDILAWICSSICPSLSKKLPSLRSKDPNSLSQGKYTCLGKVLLVSSSC